MNYQFIIMIATLHLLPVLFVSSLDAGTVKSDNTSVQSQVITPMKHFAAHRKTVLQDTSVLEENGYFYNYKGKQVKLLLMKNRFTLFYKENEFKKNPLFKQSKFFRNAGYRSFRTGHKPFEVMTVDKNVIENKSSREVIKEIISEIENDTSVLFTAPVYYEPKSGEEVIITDRIAVKVSDEKDISLREAIASEIDGEYEKILMPNVLIFKCHNLSSKDVLQRCMTIQNVSGVIWAQPEMTTRIEKYYVPNDTFYDRQWHHKNTGLFGGVSGADMNVTSAWDIQKMGDTNITIAVLDDGVDINHPDLSIKAGGWDFCGNDDDPSPSTASDNHGTAVAGVAAATGNNKIGVAGIAAGAKILPIKMLDETVDLSDMQIAEAITWAYQHGADVINNSWGQETSTPSNIIEAAIINASTLGRNGRGCPVFCASGNSASSFTTYSFPFPSNSYCYIAIVYQKDETGSYGDDNIIIDNIALYGNDGYSVVFNETFSGAFLPDGWSTCGGNNGSYTPVETVPGWYRTTDVYQQGFGGQASYCSGAISDNQWTELRMPYREYKAGERLVLNVRLSTEDGHDSMKIRYYTSDGKFYTESGLSSGSHNSIIPVVSFPAGLDSAIAVGSSTDLDYRSDYSQYDVSGTGKTVDFVAPSGGGLHEIPTTDRTGEEGYSTTDYYEQFSGTSSATPAAAGLAALILSKNSHLSRNKVLEVMRYSCDKIGNVTYVNGIHKEYGYGRLNARKALENLPPAITGQYPVAMLINGSITLTPNDLQIFDAETPAGPFTLTMSGGSNYSVSGTTITASNGFIGTLAVPVKISDGTFTSDVFTMLVSVRATNAAPVISGQKVLTMLEDGKLRLFSDSLSITDSDDPYGPFSLLIGTGSNYTVSGDTIVPLNNFNGVLTIPVTVSDRITRSAPFNVIITVNPVNDTPFFTAGSNITINEDNGFYTNSEWATGIGSGPANESGQSVLFKITVTNSALFAVLPSVSSSGAISFTPATNANGTSSVTIFLQDDGDTANGGKNKSASKVISITVMPVNDPPIFVKGPVVSVFEDAGLQTLPDWATITPGASNESGQDVTVSITVSDTTLFSVKPIITNDGKLSFKPAPNRFGSATVTVELTDNGGTSNGGVATTTADPFSITILPVNDIPVFTPGLTSISVEEDAGDQSFANWAKNISAGQGESDQKLSFSVVNNNPSLFLSQPAIDSEGKLTFTSAPDANGSAMVKIRLFDDGGTENGGTDSSSINPILNIDVKPVNDVPLVKISRKLEMEPGSELIIAISATDADGETPEISVKNLPSFATFAAAAGKGIANITCRPIADTGTFVIGITAEDSTVSLDTTVTLWVRIVPKGDILIRGVSSQAITRLHASAGWTGKPVFTGPGKISNVREGTYLLTISDSGARTGYYYSVVTSGKIDTISAIYHPQIPIMFTAGDSLRTSSGLINAGKLVSVVIDDADNDGINDIIYTGDDGVVNFCKGNDSIFNDKVSIHSGQSGKNILRCADWNEDGFNDILMANINGNIHISFGAAGGLFSKDSLLFSTNTGCTGMELVENQALGKGMYLGFSNGTMQYITFNDDGSRSTRIVRNKSGQEIDAGDDAAMLSLDINGDGKNELLIGNNNGSVQAFSLKSADTVSTLGMVTTGGMPLHLSGGVVLSSTFDISSALPAIVFSDGNGTLYRSNAMLRGDITNDGTVDILDLQQLGIHWGQRFGDAEWFGAANLSVNTSTSDPQIINALDLQILGNFWGISK